MCERVKMGGGVALVMFAGPVYRLGGTLFEMHSYCGPIVLTKKGDPAANQPDERHPFWRLFDAWVACGKRVTEHNVCILEPESQADARA